MAFEKIRKSDAKALIDLIFKPLEFTVTIAEASAMADEDRKKAKNAEKILKLLKETFQDIAVLATEE